MELRILQNGREFISKDFLIYAMEQEKMKCQLLQEAGTQKGRKVFFKGKMETLCKVEEILGGCPVRPEGSPLGG